MVIENKVESNENDNQTDRYFDHFEQSKAVGETVIYVYLTPISTPDLKELKEPECNCKQYIQINYQSLVDYLLEPALEQNISTKTKNIISEYLQSLSQASLDDETEGHKQGLIMALGKEERDLLSKFWEKNQKLIIAALDAQRFNPDLNKEERDGFTEVSDIIQKQDKDRSTFNILYDGVQFEPGTGIIKADLGLQTVNLLKAKGLIDEKVIDFLKLDTSCGFPLLKNKQEPPNNDSELKKYRFGKPAELTYNNTDEYYVVRNWGKDNIQLFIKRIHERFPSITYKQTNL